MCVCESPVGGKLQNLSLELFLRLLSVSASALRQGAGLLFFGQASHEQKVQLWCVQSGGPLKTFHWHCFTVRRT